ncbi:MAG: cysteine rich repeat-containing protein [Methylosarcina sp.]
MNIDKKLSAAVFGLAFSLAACAAPANKNAELVTKPAAKWPVETFFEGCRSELETYCKTVTPGDNRLLACIYAHEDKLSGQCEYALYDAAAQLEHAVAAFSYAAAECNDDLEKYCADVEIGEGRVLACLDRNDAKVSVRCKQALKDVGVNK